jgi:hypothetical protein
MVNWDGPLRTKSGKTGLLLQPTALETRRRVAICRDGRKPSLDTSTWSEPGSEVTVWLYAEDGILSCDRCPSDMDIAA